MEIKVKGICGTYVEAEATEIRTGTMDKDEAISFAKGLISSAGMVLSLAGKDTCSDEVFNILEYVDDLCED